MSGAQRRILLVVFPAAVPACRLQYSCVLKLEDNFHDLEDLVVRHAAPPALGVFVSEALEVLAANDGLLAGPWSSQRWRRVGAGARVSVVHKPVLTIACSERIASSAGFGRVAFRQRTRAVKDKPITPRFSACHYPHVWLVCISASNANCDPHAFANPAKHTLQGSCVGLVPQPARVARQ